MKKYLLPFVSLLIFALISAVGNAETVPETVDVGLFTFTVPEGTTAYQTGENNQWSYLYPDDHAAFIIIKHEDLGLTLNDAETLYQIYYEKPSMTTTDVVVDGMQASELSGFDKDGNFLNFCVLVDGSDVYCLTYAGLGGADNYYGLEWLLFRGDIRCNATSSDNP